MPIARHLGTPLSAEVEDLERRQGAEPPGSTCPSLSSDSNAGSGLSTPRTHSAVACEASDSCDALQNREGRKKIKPQDRSRLDANASTTAEAGPENRE